MQWWFQRQGVPRAQLCASTFGSVIHAAILVLEEGRDLGVAQDAFRQWWSNPAQLEPGLEIQRWLPKRSYEKYLDDGLRILRSWWSVIEWSSDVVFAREKHFVVPVGSNGHELEGTIDKLSIRYHPKTNEHRVMVSDYKTGRRLPTYEYLRQNVQFTAYAYATTRREFWAGVEHGEHHFQELQGLGREGEWIHLVDPTIRYAGERTEQDFRRLAWAVDHMAASIEMRIFPLSIDGDSCTFCSFRKECGLQSLEEEGYYQPPMYAS